MEAVFHNNNLESHERPYEQHPEHPRQTPPSDISLLPLPTALDVLRYRYHHGVNLGGIFVLERWLFPRMFQPGTEGTSELDAVIASLNASDVFPTKQKWEAHWNSALLFEDISDLAYRLHVTTVRLPIGYFTVGCQFTINTPFYSEGLHVVYSEAWQAVARLCTRLYMAGIGVILDLHAVPGGANRDSHSGTSSGRADLWTNPDNLQLLADCITSIASTVATDQIPGIVGIQVCNEAIYGAPGAFDFYRHLTNAVSAIDPSIPLYISDAWNLGDALDFAASINTINQPLLPPVVVDTHKYYCFTAADRAQTPVDIIHRVENELHELLSRGNSVVDKGAYGCVVGEWSGALDPETWAWSSAADRNELQRQFVLAQSKTWHERASGSFFWSTNMDGDVGHAWNFLHMNGVKAIAVPKYLTLDFADVRARRSHALEHKAFLKRKDVDGHTEYWHQTAPWQEFEHWRFEEGWELGFQDAVVFWEMRLKHGIRGTKQGADKIGLLDLWILKRLRQLGAGDFVWEWEHGFRQGVNSAQRALGMVQ
ncbi:Glucan 1,3-beta-glucosidase 3 [Xylographa opegraphella]|nr:Glucan 1,3-beta-glucosidase 3 [Xylographa opegraphella]